MSNRKQKAGPSKPPRQPRKAWLCPICKEQRRAAYWNSSESELFVMNVATNTGEEVDRGSVEIAEVETEPDGI